MNATPFFLRTMQLRRAGASVALGLTLACSTGDPSSEFTFTHLVQVTGVVTDTAGAPLAGIRVSVGSVPDFGISTRTTAADGHYTVTLGGYFVSGSEVPDSVSLPVAYYAPESAPNPVPLLDTVTVAAVYANGRTPTPAVQDAQLQFPQ